MLRGRCTQLAALTFGLAGLLAAAPTAQGAFFEYATTVSIDSNNSPSAGILSNGLLSSSISSGGNTFTLTTQSSAVGVPHLATPTQINPLSFSEVATGTAGTVLDFNYTLTLSFQDFASPASVASDGSGSITFSGRISGTIGGGSSLFSQLSFVPNPGILPLPPSGITLSVDTPVFAAPGPNTQGSLTLTVRSVPEPGSIALLGVGLVGTFGVLRRRKLSRTA